MKIAKKVLLSLVLLAPAAALADIRYYIGAGFGGTRLEANTDITLGAYLDDGNGGLTPVTCPADEDPTICSPEGSPIQTTLNKFKGTDVGYRVFGGVRFGRYFGLEIGYVDLGKPDDSLDLIIPEPASGLAPQTAVSLKLQDQLDGTDVYALGAWPFNDKWEIFGKVGIISWNSKFRNTNAYMDSFSNTGNETLPTVLPTSFVEKDDGTDMAYAVGTNYQATEHMILRAEGTWYDIEDTSQAWILGGYVIYSF